MPRCVWLLCLVFDVAILARGREEGQGCRKWSLLPRRTLIPQHLTWESRLGVRRRKYFIRLPARYSPSSVHSMVIDFHSYYYNARYEASWSNWYEVADKNNIIMVYPEGADDNVGRFEGWRRHPEYKEFAQPMPSWNALGSSSKHQPHRTSGILNRTMFPNRDCVSSLNGTWEGLYPCYKSCLELHNLECQKFDNLPGYEFNPPCISSSCYNDTRMIISLIEHLHTKVCVDHRRIYATGQSAGGMMALMVGTKLSNLFAATVVSSAAPLLAAEQFNATVPLLVARGLRDGTIPAEKPLGYAPNPDGTWCKCNGTVDIDNGKYPIEPGRNGTGLSPCPACPDAPHDFLKGRYAISGDGYFYRLNQDMLQDWLEALQNENINLTRQRYKTPYDGIGLWTCESLATQKSSRNWLSWIISSVKAWQTTEKYKTSTTSQKHMVVSCYFDGKHCYPFQDDDCNWKDDALKDSYWATVSWAFMQAHSNGDLSDVDADAKKLFSQATTHLGLILISVALAAVFYYIKR